MGSIPGTPKTAISAFSTHQLFYFLDIGVLGLPENYLARTEWKGQIRCVGINFDESYEKIPGVRGVDGTNAIGEHPPGFRDATAGYKFNVVAWRW